MPQKEQNPNWYWASRDSIRMLSHLADWREYIFAIRSPIFVGLSRI